MRAMSDGHGLPGESEIDGAGNSDRDRGGLRPSSLAARRLG